MSKHSAISPAETSRPGVFAVGDVAAATSSEWRQRSAKERSPWRSCIRFFTNSCN